MNKEKEMERSINFWSSIIKENDSIVPEHMRRNDESDPFGSFGNRGNLDKRTNGQVRIQNKAKFELDRLEKGVSIIHKARFWNEDKYQWVDWHNSKRPLGWVPRRKVDGIMFVRQIDLSEEYFDGASWIAFS